MDRKKQPTRANGKICYMEIPALDAKQSANFYQQVFDWEIRADDAGNIAFDDTVGEVSGMWVTGRKPASEPGILISIMVDDIAATAILIANNGGKIIQPEAGTSERTAIFSDPAGNVFCLYQSSRRS